MRAPKAKGPEKKKKESQTYKGALLPCPTHKLQPCNVRSSRCQVQLRKCSKCGLVTPRWYGKSCSCPECGRSLNSIKQVKCGLKLEGVEESVE